jgi:hypothetical protein
MGMFDTVYVSAEVFAVWRPWTEEEIAESNRGAERGGLGALLRKTAGEGCFLPEAYLPEDRR